MRGSGGSEGGIGMFSIGFVLSLLSLYFFFDSVQVTTQGFGALTSFVHRTAGGGMAGTASMGLVFVPFFLGVVSLFVNAKQTWAWILMWCGLGILVIEILSRITFLMNVRTSYLLILVVLFAAGAGLMIRSYRSIEATQPPKNT